MKFGFVRAKIIILCRFVKGRSGLLHSDLTRNVLAYVAAHPCGSIHPRSPSAYTAPSALRVVFALTPHANAPVSRSSFQRKHWRRVLPQRPLAKVEPGLSSRSEGLPRQPLVGSRHSKSACFGDIFWPATLAFLHSDGAGTAAGDRLGWKGSHARYSCAIGRHDRPSS